VSFKKRIIISLLGGAVVTAGYIANDLSDNGSVVGYLICIVIGTMIFNRCIDWATKPEVKG
jgi:hypothetical protein